MSNIVRIPSKLYHQLDLKGGQKLIAFYCILKHSRRKEIKYFSYVAKNGKTISGNSLIRRKTNISLNSIKKYLPMVLEMELVRFDHKGDFVFLGTNKLKSVFNKRMVPVSVGHNLIDTSHRATAVKLASNYKSQLREISKKQHRSELLTHKDSPRNNDERRLIAKIIRTYGENITITDKAVLSNESYARIKDKTKNNKSKGQYWKSVLTRKKIVISQRRYESIKKMTYVQYKKARIGSGFRNLIYRKGYLCVELVSSFNPINLVMPKIA